MKIYKNKITDETLQIFRNHYERYKGIKKLNDINSHDIDIRTRIWPEHEAWKEIKKICIEHFPDVKDKEIYANYQRQSKPTFMHVDEYGAFRENPTWTIIIPMHDDPRLSVVIWKKIFNNNDELKNFIMNFPYDTSKKLNNVSEQVALQHTPFNYKQPNEFLSDYVDLDGVFNYRLGDYVFFDTNQLHVTSNFSLLNEYKHKDLVQIHIGTTSNKGYNPYENEEQYV